MMEHNALVNLVNCWKDAWNEYGVLLVDDGHAF